MYYTHFGLQQPPYRITPDTRSFFSGAKRGDILNAIIYALVNGEGITKVVGEVGSGKTMLCRMLETQLPKHIEVVYLANPTLSPDDILHAIALELGLPLAREQSPDRLQIMKALEQYLLDKHANNQQVIVFVEEAQGMPLETLEQIRLLSNLETQQHKLLQIVLFGQPELDDNLAAVHVRQIKDRITNSFYLPPMGVEDIRDYLMFRLRHAGYRGPNIFSRAAALLIARLSNGLIRRINILADKAMLAAYTHSATTINWRHVLAASRDSSFGSGQLGKRLIRGGLGLLLILSLIAGSTLLPFTAALPSRAELTVPNLPVTAIATPISPATLVDERRTAALNWLKQADPRHYSIQVLTAAADANYAIEQFLSQPGLQSQLGNIFVTDSVLKGNPMVNVVYGEFSSFSSANQALNTLPDEVKRNQPYVRNVRDLQTAAEKI